MRPGRLRWFGHLERKSGKMIVEMWRQVQGKKYLERECNHESMKLIPEVAVFRGFISGQTGQTNPSSGSVKHKINDDHDADWVSWPTMFYNDHDVYLVGDTLQIVIKTQTNAPWCTLQIAIQNQKYIPCQLEKPSIILQEYFLPDTALPKSLGSYCTMDNKGWAECCHPRVILVSKTLPMRIEDEFNLGWDWGWVWLISLTTRVGCLP